MKTRRYFTSKGRPWVLETPAGDTWLYTASLTTKDHAVLLLTRSAERVYNNETGETLYGQPAKDLPS